MKSFIADGSIASYNSKSCTRRIAQLFPTHPACGNSGSLKGLQQHGLPPLKSPIDSNKKIGVKRSRSECSVV